MAKSSVKGCIWDLGVSTQLSLLVVRFSTSVNIHMYRVAPACSRGCPDLFCTASPGLVKVRFDIDAGISLWWISYLKNVYHYDYWKLFC